LESRDFTQPFSLKLHEMNNRRTVEACNSNNMFILLINLLVIQQFDMNTLTVRTVWRTTITQEVHMQMLIC